MYLGEVIHNYRKQHNMSMQNFADKCDLSKGYIAMLERNVNPKTGAPIVPSLETFAKVSAAMKMTINDLMNMVDENQPVIMQPLDDINTTTYTPSNSTKVPVYGCIPAGVPLEAIECIDGYVDIPDEWLKSGDTYFALKVKGSSMSPKYIDGDIIILRRQSDCESGQDAAVRVNGDEATLKKVIKQQFGIMLQPINPEYEPRMYEYNDENYPIEIMGVVVQLRRDV